MVEEALKRGHVGSSAHKGFIAVIDDDYRVLESLDDLLQSSGYRTLLSPSAEQFLASAGCGNIDVLISDIGLPGMSGIELLRTMQLSSGCPPAILITGRGEAHLEQDASDLGVLRLLLKPFDTGELLAMLDAQFAR
jgi:DNA-binding response OmpR family regulator